MMMLTAFKDQVEKVGMLRRAWFTTFNFGFDLIEGYILPVLAGVDFPKTPQEFETLQVQLFSPEEGSAPDIRIFHDIRTRSQEKPKRTSVAMHGVDFRVAELQKNEVRFRSGVFHPKVIYLEGEDGAVIGAGSANLTIDGWARNRECFHFVELKGQVNRKEVKKFFSRLHSWCGLRDEFEMPPVRRDERNPSGWRFVSALSDDTYLDLLFEGRKEKALTVWSPYFSENLVGLSQELRENYSIGSFGIIPSLNSGGKMMLGEDGARAFLDEDDRNEILREDSREAEDRFSHAKVWMSSSALAIGSWNLTTPAVGLSKSKANVEAGLVLFGDERRRPAGLESIADPADLAMDPDELNAEQEAWLAGLEPPVVPVSVWCDWKDRTWSWRLEPDGPWMRKRPRLVLPMGTVNMKTIDLAKQPEGSCGIAQLGFVPRQRSVEAWHRAPDGDHAEPVWIIERNPAERPVARFDGWDALIAGLIQGAPESLAETKPSGEGDGEGVDGDLGGGGALALAPGQTSYFRLFAAMKSARYLLDQAADEVGLRRRILVYPGCVAEIIESATEQFKKRSEWSPVFRWFLAHELHALVSCALVRWREVGEAKELPPFFKQMRQAIPKPPPLDDQDPALAQYLEYARSLAGYR